MIPLASSAMPVSWLAPPVRTSRRPACAGKTRAFQPVAHEFEDLLGAGLDDGDQIGLRKMRRMFAVLADLDDGDRLALVRGRGCTPP